MRANARGDIGRLLLAVLLKTRQDFGCFPVPNEVHAGTIAHVAARLGLAAPHPLIAEVHWPSKLYRYHAAVRTHLGVTPYGETAERLLSSTVLDAAETMSDPADLINRAIEALHSMAVDLPGFSTLDRLVSRLRADIHERMFSRVAATPTLRQQIDSLPLHIASAWCSRYANEGMDLEARAMIGREAAVVRAAGQEPDALAVWMRLADAAGRQREPPPALMAAAALAGLAAGVRTQGFFEVPSKADPAL